MSKQLLRYLFVNRHRLSRADKSVILFAIKISLCLFFAPAVFADPAPEVIQTIAYEASNQPFYGQVAVASVIKTRAAKRHQTPRQVVLAPHQFSCWRDGRPTQSRKLTAREIATARRAWKAAKPGKYDHYAHHSIDNYWTRQAVRAERIGDHVFYALP